MPLTRLRSLQNCPCKYYIVSQTCLFESTKNDVHWWFPCQYYRLLLYSIFYGTFDARSPIYFRIYSTAGREGVSQVILAYKFGVPSIKEKQIESASAVDMMKCSWDSALFEIYYFYRCRVISWVAIVSAGSRYTFFGPSLFSSCFSSRRSVLEASESMLKSPYSLLLATTDKPPFL